MDAKMSGFRGFLFDLDGVIVDTTKYHFEAWRRMAKQLGFELDNTAQSKMLGLSRMVCLEKILDWGGIYLTEAEKLYWSDVKNTWYVEMIGQMKPEEVLPGAALFLQKTQSAGFPAALISSSRNAKAVLQSTRLESYFDVVVDGTMIIRSKPDPDRYKLAAALLGLPVSACLVFEDTPDGITGACQAGCGVVAIAQNTHEGCALCTVPSFENLQPELLAERLAFLTVNVTNTAIL